jgi:hypothetical protein
LGNNTRDDALNNLTFGVHVDMVITFNATSDGWEELGPLDVFTLGRGYWLHSKEDIVWDVPLDTLIK